MNSYIKTFLQAMGVGALAALIGIIILEAVAQPASSTRLKDLSDVKIATAPANGAALVWNDSLKRWTNGTPSGGSGGSVGLADLEPTQFTTNGGIVKIKSGALQTNGVFSGSLTLDGSPVLTNASGGITNSGLTLNTVVKATGTNSVGDSSLSETNDGSNYNFEFGPTNSGVNVIIAPKVGDSSGNNLNVRGGVGLDGDGGGLILSGAPGVGTDKNGGYVLITGGAATGTGTAGPAAIQGNYVLLSGPVQASSSLTLSGQTGFPYTDDGTQLLRNGVPVGGGGAGVTNYYDSLVVTNSTTINTQIFNVAKGGHLTVNTALTLLPAGANKLIGTDGNSNLVASALTGDVTTSGMAATIANNAVSYAKMQDVSATQRALGRNTAGSGDPEEITGTQILDWIGSTRGNVLYRGASAWSALAVGTAGQVLQSGGAGADPSWTTLSSGMSASASAYAITGGSSTATANWTALSAAYTAAKSATPNGSALSANNRFTLFLLPGVYDLGSSTLTLDTLYIDIVGLSKNSGAMTYTASPAKGDTVLTSSGTVINVNTTADSSSHDIVLANLCANTTTASSSEYAISVTQSAFGAKWHCVNVQFVFAGSANPPRTMPSDKGFNGTWVDVRAWHPKCFGDSVFVSIACNGTFIRCKAGSTSFGNSANPGSAQPQLTGTFIDCEGDSGSFGSTTTAGGAVLSGRFFRCIGGMALGGGGAGASLGGSGATMSGYFQNCKADPANNNFGGGTMSGTMVGCSGTASISWTSVSGRVSACDFPGWSETSFASRAADAAVNIASTGWTNTFGKNAVVYFDGTAVTATVYNSAGTAVYTNATALAGGSILLQPSGKVILSGTGVTGRATVF